MSAALSASVGCYAGGPREQVIRPHLITPDSMPVSHQLIIKFKPGTIGCDKSGVARFSDSQGVQLVLIRPMSGAACVVTHLAVDGKTLIQELEKLNRHASVEWAEPDALMKTH